MAGLDTLWFDLKINDMTESQIKEIKTRIEKDLGHSLDIGKNIEHAVNNTNLKVKIGADTSVVEASIRRLKELLSQGSLSSSERAEMTTLSKVVKNLTEDKVRLARANEIARRSADAHTLSQERLAAASLRTEKAQQSLANAHQRAAQSSNSHVNANIKLGQSLTGLVSITGDLRNQIGMLISLYTVEHLLKNEVQIGGEFEKQKLAMGSMLGSLEQADDIFNRMKNLALTSPFNFKDLSNYSRQLAAYGTDYKDLYDTTNRLADISAGLGGDMSRLVLAFSQVKAAAYLRGQEMRQFTEFGVALPDLLAKKYSDAEHKIVTAGDVIERVSKRMVSFNDVKDVLWQSTDKGGKFYGMQDVLAQSTSGMASNLKDAIDTMYYDIANSNSGVIKDTIKNITELVSHWRELSSVLIAGTGVYTIHRLAMAAHNRIIGQGTAETLKGVMASKQEEASILRRKALYGELSAEEKAVLATSKVLTFEDVKKLATSKAINSEALMRLVNTRKITAEQALQLSSTLALTEGEIKYLTSLKSLDIQLAFSTSRWNTFTIGVYKNFIMLGSNIKMIASGIKTALASMLTPMNILMAGAFIGMDAYMEYKQQMEHLDEVNKQTIKNAEDGTKTLNDFLSTHPIEMVLKGGDKNEIDKLIDEYKEQITSSPIDMSGFITNVDTITNATQKLKALREEMQALRDADEVISKNGNPFSQSQKNDESWTPDWFSSIDKGLIKLANFGINNFSIIPRSWTQGLRNFALQWEENGKSIEGIMSDLQSSSDDLNSEMSKLTKNDIDKSLSKLREQFPQLAQEIDRMRMAGASNNEVIKAMLTMARENKITLFENIDINTFDNYANNVKVMSDRMAYYVEDGIKRINNSMSNADVEGHTEKWKLAIVKSAQEQAKAWNLSGYSLEQWTFMVEDAVSKNSARIQDHPKVWQDMYNGIKQILWKNGYDINNATKEQVNQAFQTYKNETSKTKPWLANFLAMMNAYTRKNPIYIWNEMRFVGQEGGAVLSGRGKELSSNYTLNSKYKADLANIKNDKDAADYIKSKYDTYQQDLKDAKSNRKKVNDLNNKWNEFYNDWNSEMDVDFIIGGQKTTKAKKTGGGSKEDTFLKDMRARLDSVKKAMDEYKKWIQAGKSEAASIGDVESMGIFSKGTFSKMTTESELNAWYKRTIKNLEDMMRKNKPSTERKKFLNELLSNLTDFDRDEFKRKLDDVGKKIDKTLSETIKNWDFYKKIKDSTGNSMLASQLAFGGVTQSKNVLEDIKSKYKNEPMSKGIGFNDLLKMSDSELEAKGISKLKEYRDKYLEEDNKIKQDTISNLVELIQKNKDYSQQILDIRTKLAKDLDDIENNRTNLEKSGVDVNRMKQQTTKNANEQIGKIQFDEFKNSGDWEKAFDDLSRVSTATLDRLMARMQEMKDSGKNLPVQDFKELINVIKKLREEIENRNPFKGLANSIKDYISATKDVSAKKEQLNYISKGGQVLLASSYNQKTGKIDATYKTQQQAENDYTDSKDKQKAAWDEISASMQKTINRLQGFSSALSMAGQMVESLGGGTGASDAAGIAGGMLGGAMSMSSLGPWGMAAGAAMGAITGIANLHDKKLDRAIEKSKQKVQELDLAYKTVEDSMKYALGNQSKGTNYETAELKRYKEALNTFSVIKAKGSISVFDLQNLESAYQIIQNTTDATKTYYETGNAYQYQLDLYKEKLTQLNKQRADEDAKKNSDQSKLNDYDSQIEEMNTKVTQYWQNLASEIYGIDLKSWAQEFGDALFDAWQKGESAAIAFKNKASDIISSLVKKMMATNLIEPLFKDMQTYLFGDKGVLKDGNMSDSDLSGIMTHLSKIQDSANTAYDYLDKIDLVYQQKYGSSLKSSSSSSSTAASISGITEEEANIWASYMNAIRQDVALIKADLVDEGIYEKNNVIMQSQLDQMRQIASNTAANARFVEEIRNMFNDVILGTKKIHV